MATAMMAMPAVATTTNTTETKEQYPSLIRSEDILLEGNMRLVNQINVDSEVLCLRYNHNGKLLAIGLTTGTIMIYSVESKAFVYVLRHGSPSSVPVTSMKWKPEGPDEEYGYQLMATYVSGEVKTWHVTTGSCLKSHKEDDVQLLVGAYNSSGSHCIAGGHNGCIYLYDEITGRKISTLGPSVNKEVMDGHVMRVFALQYHPLDENVFVSGGWDNTIQWWDTRTSDRYSIKKISGPRICGEGLDIEKNTQKLVAVSWRRHQNCQVFDFGSGKRIKEMDAYGKSSMLYCAQWKDRSSLIVGGSNGHIVSLADYNTGLTIGSALNLPGGVCALDNTRIGSHPSIAAASGKHILVVSDDV